MCKKILKASLFTLLVAASISYAQDTNGLADSIEVCPKNSVLLTENEHTRLIHFKLKSGQKCPMHRTTGGFAYVISGATITLITADGVKTPIVLKDGQALSYGPAEHVVEGTRGTFEAIFLENKTSQ
jgi:quercetin dioxygenase-like cupin family protein